MVRESIYLIYVNIEIRGSTSLESVERGGQEVVGQMSSANPNTLVESVIPLVKGQVGSSVRHVLQAGEGQDFTGGESGSSLGPVQYVIPDSLCGHSLDGPSNQPKENCSAVNLAIVNLDNLINNTRGKVVGGVRYSDLSEEASSDSASNSQSFDEIDKGTQGKGKGPKQRRSHLPLASLLGPKCLRFAGMVNNNISLVKRRNMVGSLEMSPSDSGSKASIVQEGQGDVVLAGQVADLERNDERPQLLEDPILEVILPFQQGPQPQSGVNLLLRDESLQDVEGFLAARDNPEGKILEAQKLLDEQLQLGFTFDHQVEKPIARMVGMEDRDREECVKRQGPARPQ
ncbi:hypothetical protein P8452_53444 [Trifolium repens]|nr:hypothetical protein P8452_53444 [Trifolium repens]